MAEQGLAEVAVPQGKAQPDGAVAPRDWTCGPDHVTGAAELETGIPQQRWRDWATRRGTRSQGRQIWNRGPRMAHLDRDWVGAENSAIGTAGGAARLGSCELEACRRVGGTGLAELGSRTRDRSVSIAEPRWLDWDGRGDSVVGTATGLRDWRRRRIAELGWCRWERVAESADFGRRRWAPARGSRSRDGGTWMTWRGWHVSEWRA